MPPWYEHVSHCNYSILGINNSNLKVILLQICASLHAALKKKKKRAIICLALVLALFHTLLLVPPGCKIIMELKGKPKKK
jgi:hypothetical protein